MYQIEKCGNDEIWDTYLHYKTSTIGRVLQQYIQVLYREANELEVAGLQCAIDFSNPWKRNTSALNYLCQILSYLLYYTRK